MFKINESVYDEVVAQLEVNLNKIAFDEATELEQKKLEALNLLNSSAELLEQFGFEKEAEIITKLILINASNIKHFHTEESGIPVIYLIKDDPDFNTFCASCAKKLQDEGKDIIGHAYEEGPNRECALCGTDLESAMGQDAYYKTYGDSDDNNTSDYKKTHEGPDEYKKEKLEDQYLEEILHELDEGEEDQVFI